MPDETPVPTARDLLTSLHEQAADFVVIGGMAAVLHGSAYVTADLDVLYSRDPQNYERLARALHPFNPKLRGVAEDLPFTLDARALQTGMNFTLSTDAGDFDLLGEAAGLEDYPAIRNRAERVEVFGCRIQILSLDDLISSKKAAGRPKDLQLLPELLELKKLLGQ